MEREKAEIINHMAIFTDIILKWDNEDLKVWEIAESA